MRSLFWSISASDSPSSATGLQGTHSAASHHKAWAAYVRHTCMHKEQLCIFSQKDALLHSPVAWHGLSVMSQGATSYMHDNIQKNGRKVGCLPCYCAIPFVIIRCLIINICVSVRLPIAIVSGLGPTAKDGLGPKAGLSCHLLHAKV